MIRDAVWRKELKHHVGEPGFIQPARSMSAIAADRRLSYRRPSWRNACLQSVAERPDATHVMSALAAAIG